MNYTTPYGLKFSGLNILEWLMNHLFPSKDGAWFWAVEYAGGPIFFIWYVGFWSVVYDSQLEKWSVEKQVD